MGGEIAVRSAYGKGSVFTVTLPQRIIAGKDTATRMTAPNARVLVVDDIDVNLTVAKGLLRPYCMTVDPCRSGKEALNAVQETCYDLVFLDYMMPLMDGVDTLAQIRALGGKYETLPVIALTANTAPGIKEMFLQNGFNGFLSKPLDTTLLNAILEKWLPREKQQHEQSAAAAPEKSAHSIAIAGVDVEKGIKLTGGTAEGYLRTLTVFHKDGYEKIKKIKEALEADDLRLYTVHVHSLKSACAVIGHDGLSNAAKTLEAAGKNNDKAFVRANSGRFIADIEDFLCDLKNALPAAAPPNGSEGLNAGLAKLKEALETLNPEAIGKAAAELDKYADAEGVGGVLEYVLIGAYDEAVTMIKKLTGGSDG
jgi:CheY-like chemotaxis protein/HPt (histidine-containing phosphotransfer) domain-containing protein